MLHTADSRTAITTINALGESHLMLDETVSTGVRKKLDELSQWCHKSEDVAGPAVQAGEVQARGRHASDMRSIGRMDATSVNGQVAVPADGQLKVPTPRVDQVLVRVVPPLARASRMR